MHKIMASDGICNTVVPATPRGSGNAYKVRCLTRDAQAYHALASRGWSMPLTQRIIFYNKALDCVDALLRCGLDTIARIEAARADTMLRKERRALAAERFASRKAA